MKQITLSSVLGQVALGLLPRLLPVHAPGKQERGKNEHVQDSGQGALQAVLPDEFKGRNATTIDTTIEVGQLGTKDAKTIVLYLSHADKTHADKTHVGQSHVGQAGTELVLWDCASPALKKEALRRALDPLHLLRRVEAQMERHLQRVKAVCSCCLSCEPQGA